MEKKDRIKRFWKTHNYSTKELIETFAGYAALTNDERQKQELRLILQNYINCEKKRRKSRTLKYLKFRQMRKNDNRLWFKLRNLQMVDEELDRRNRIRIIRHAKILYHRDYGLTKKFNRIKVASKNRFKSKIKALEHRDLILRHKLTHKQVFDVIGHYSAFTKDADHQKNMDAFIDNYRSQSIEKIRKRIRRNNKIERYRISWKASQRIIREFKKIDHMLDVQTRTQIAKRARNYYHQNYSLTKEFKEPKGKIKLKEIGIEKKI